MRLCKVTLGYIRLLKITALLMLFITLYTLHFTQAYAEEKNWCATGDGSTWSDDDNWSPAAAPTSSDDVLIDVSDASVECAETFAAKSITIGGRESTTLASNNFVFGTISPDSGSDIGILTRSGGTFTLTGAGTITVQGQYKDSEETLTPEPSFMFWLE